MWCGVCGVCGVCCVLCVVCGVWCVVWCVVCGVCVCVCVCVVQVFPSGRHAAVAVDPRRVVQNVGRLVREKVRKECPCVVSDSARCTTWRDEDEV